MTGEIILLNPSNPARRPKRKGQRKMAKKRTVRRRSAALVVRRNPAPVARRRRRSSGFSRAAGTVGGALGGLQIGAAAIDAAKNAGGMLAAHFFAKRFSTGGALRDQWTWQNYALAIVGGFASGLVAEMVRKGSGKQFLQGSMALCAYRLISDTVAARVPFVSSNFGSTDITTAPAGFLGSDGQTYYPGDLYGAEDGDQYVMGADGLWRSTSDNYRIAESMKPASSLGDTVRPVSSLGDSVRPVSSLGGTGN